MEPIKNITKRGDLFALSLCKSLAATANIVSADKVKQGYKIAFGVDEENGHAIAMGTMLDNQTKVIIMYVADRKEFDEKKNMPLTGIEEIQQERSEQIGKHDFSAIRDMGYKNNELVDAAMQYLGGGDIDCWPDSWDRKWYKDNKTRVEELRIAGALIAAEIDRLKFGEKMEKEINDGAF